MLTRFAPALTCVAWLIAGAAFGQTASAPSAAVAPLTVQAAPEPKVIERQAHSFVERYAGVGNPEIDQIGRWHDAVCAEVVGLAQADQAALIKARIESVAQAVGLPASPAGCTANVEIVFTSQPQRTMDMVAKRREYLLGYYHLHDRDQLKAVSHPIQSWYVTDTSSGSSLHAGIVFVNHAPTASMGVIDDPENSAPVGCGEASRFSACYRSSFDNVFMVADAAALQGKDIGLVADYMVMLALSKPRSLDSCNILASVIDVFSKSACPGREPPDGLTPSDAAYLTSLYQADPEARKSFQQSDISFRMAKILVKAGAGGR